MTVAITASAETYRVSLDLTWTTAVTRLHVQRQDSTGAWTPVRGNDPTDWTSFIAPDTPHELRVYDYEVPFDEPVRYRANGDGGETVWSIPSNTVTVVNSGGRWVLHAVSRPTQRRLAYVVSQPKLAVALAHGQFYPLGRADPVVTYGTPHLPTGTLVLYADSHDERDKLVALLDSTETICVRSPPDNGFPAMYVALGDLDIERRPDAPRVSWDIAAPWWQVAIPVTPLVAIGATYGDVAVAYDTYGTIAASVPTYADLETGG